MANKKPEKKKASSVRKPVAKKKAPAKKKPSGRAFGKDILDFKDSDSIKKRYEKRAAEQNSKRNIIAKILDPFGGKAKGANAYIAVETIAKMKANKKKRAAKKKGKN